MRRALPFSLSVVLLVSACAPQRRTFGPGEVPRARPTTVTEEQYGHQVLNQLTQKWPLDYSDPAQLNRVTAIVERLTAAAGGSKDPWHVYLLQAPDFKNAAATRGNHVFVWTGILKSIKSDDELAAVIAHEISHVLAGHTDPDPNEEIKKMMIGIGAMAAGVAVAGTTGSPALANAAGNLTTGLTNEIGSGLLVYPYSREIELEADRVGLHLMAAGGYDPRAAIEFWTRAENDADFSTSIPFFSTHPPAEDRLAQLRGLLPGALARYENPRNQNQGGGGNGQFGAPGGPGDTFDLNKVPELRRDRERRGGPPPVPPARTPREWRVASPKAYLYTSPDTASRRIGEFRRGAIVLAVREVGGWIEIDSPDHGYLDQDALEPLRESYR